MIRDRLISYRVSLAFLIPLLVVATGGLVAWLSYTTTRASIRELTASLFGQVADQTTEETRSHLREAGPAADVLVQLLAADRTPPASDDLVRRLLLVLRANPGFSWVSYSEPDGTFTGVQRTADGTLLVNRSHIAAGATELVEETIAVDGTWRPHRHEANTGFDPRTRPYYTRAVAAKTRTWTDPYVFYEGMPGITCAEPVYGERGALRGVVTVDFDLNALSAYVAKLHPSPNARVIVYTADGFVLAHPSAHVVAGGAPGAAAKLVTAADIADDAVRAYFAADAGDEFDLAGEHYVAATRAFEPDRGLHWRVAAIAPESDFMASLARIRRDAMLVSLAVMVVAVLVAITFARRLARPLVHLAREMDEVGQFRLAGADPPRSRFREIDSMNRALARMRKGLASFAVFVPRDLVRAVLASGQRAELGGMTKPMTVFFADLAGFTSLSETMTPAALVELLAGYFDEMSQVIAAHRGTIDKFIGDAIMAFWNAPNDEPDHAVAACSAALAFQRKLEDMKRANPALAQLSARIGIATGEAVVGNIGSHDRMNYTVMGDTVNLASRLEGLGKAYGTRILVTEACRSAAGERVVMRAIDIVAVKGKTRGVRVYEPLALAGDADARVRELAELSARALEAYLARQWPEAGELYARIGDAAAETLRARCVAFEAEPPPPDWSGTFVMHEK